MKPNNPTQEIHFAKKNIFIGPENFVKSFFGKTYLKLANDVGRVYSGSKFIKLSSALF